ncbi:MAG: tetratricopeptide repeat protein [Bacteroidaceae bacterium]|nr:tetratricopeptide repeat protein [Bacteroidaceae bacterium]
MKTIYIALVTLLLASVQIPLQAKPNKGGKPVTKAMADSAYVHEDYQKAVSIYSKLLKKGQSADLYYNIGNCYYRQDIIAKAILNYERALMLDPSDKDIRFNLELSRTKTIDKVMPASEMFFVTVFKRMVKSMSISAWMFMAIASFIIMLLAVALYIFGNTVSMKKTGFTIAVLFLLVSIFANIAAYSHRQSITHRSGAIIMSTSVVVKSTPSDSGTDLFILHEGTRVEIIDDMMKEWCEVRMSDGKEGWMRKADLELI